MDFDTKLESSLNSNIDTGNISTDDFLAVFTSTLRTTTTTTTTTTTATPNGASSSFEASSFEASSSVLANTANFTTNKHLPIINSTLNPPLLTVDSQLTLTNLLESSLAGAVTTSNPAQLQTSYINDSFYFLSGGGGFFSNGSINFGSGINYYNQSITNASINGSLSGGNLTDAHWDGRYPSGYTLPQIVIASIIVTILMIIIVVGNMLVIIAIATEKSLKNIQNWFIASLAVADFFLGLIIMPFSLANELMGYWIFGSWWCDIHSAMDVLLCTASIMNLCLISLDRYWSITKAVDYLKSRTPARAAVMITAVWIMSALICIPPLLGWKVKSPEGPLPKCQLSEDIGYVLYSALGSFYIPSCIMVFVYIRIYFAAKARARRGIKKHPRKTNNEQVTSFTTANKKGTIPMPSSSATLNQNQQRQIATIETPPNSATVPMQIPTVTMDLASDISTSEAADMEPQTLAYTNNSSNVQVVVPPPPPPTIVTVVSSSNSTPGSPNCKETLGVSTIATGHGVALNVPVPPSMAAAAATTPDSNASSITILNNNNGSIAHAATANTNVHVVSTTTTTLTPGPPMNTLSVTPNELRVSPIAGRCRALSVGIDTDMVSEFDPSSSDSGVVSRCAVVKPLKFRLCQPIFGRKSNQQRRNESKAAAAAAAAASVQLKSPKSVEVVKAELEPAIPKTPKPRDPEKEKRRIARKKEKRATLILGLIMGSFIACWLPFFFLYILMPACGEHCHIPASAFSVAFWLGYMNSALNPAIYTIFNKDFRRAFRRILFK